MAKNSAGPFTLTPSLSLAQSCPHLSWPVFTPATFGINPPRLRHPTWPTNTAIRPTYQAGHAPDFPRDQRHLVTFKATGANKTEMTVTEFDWTVCHMLNLAELGLNQCLDKMAATFPKP
jgi:hypothetical protein